MNLAQLRRTVGERTPSSLKPVLRRVRANVGLDRVRRRPRWGNLRRARPFSERWGYDRGTSIDRNYINPFIAAQRACITGHVLEVKEDLYATSCGHDIERVEILDVNSRNLGATLVADLGEAGSIPENMYDCAIVTQTLQYIPAVDVAMANLWRSLKPGGHLLVTVPCAAKCESTLRDGESWRFLPAGLEHLIEQACDPAPSSFTIQTYGNLTVTIASLLGLAAEELRPAELERVDADYPLILTLIATKP